MQKYIDLIENGYENEYLDYKEKQYVNCEALLLDIMSFANSSHDGEKYIIVGVKDKKGIEKIYSGIERETLKDSAEYQQFVLANIEPEIKFDYIPVEHRGLLFGVFRIHKTDNKPYMLKKKFRKLDEGLCYIRKGSTQSRALRSDFDQFYFRKNSISVKIVDQLIVVEKNGTFDILLKNHSNNPITFMGGSLEIMNGNNEILTQHRLYGVDDVHQGADFTFHLDSKTERKCEALVGFSSSDCLKLNLDEYGNPPGLFNVRFYVWDSEGNTYEDIYEDIALIARGKVLWKVELKNNKKKKRFGFKNVF